MIDLPAQSALFNFADELPHGLVYQPDFLSGNEEAALLQTVSGLPFNEARFQQYTARRRIVRFGEGEYPARYANRCAAALSIADSAFRTRAARACAPRRKGGGPLAGPGVAAAVMLCANTRLNWRSGDTKNCGC